MSCRFFVRALKGTFPLSNTAVRNCSHSLSASKNLFHLEENVLLRCTVVPFLQRNTIVRKFSSALGTENPNIPEKVETSNVAEKIDTPNVLEKDETYSASKKSETSISISDSSPQDVVANETSLHEDVDTRSDVISHHVFMRGLPYSVTKEDIIKFFNPLGITPSKVTLRYDRYGFTNGKAEVEFKTEEEVVTALKNHHAYIGNRYIELSTTEFPMMNADRVPITRREVSGMDDMRRQFNRSDREQQQHTVKLMGLPYSATANDVYEFFSSLNIEPTGIDLKVSQQGYQTGICFVKFKTHKEAVEALKNNNKYIGDRYIRITLAPPNNRMQYRGVMYEDRINFHRPNEDMEPFRRF